MMNTQALALLACGAFAVPPATAQTVHVVDINGGAGADFSSLQAAVNGSADGDVILVKSGDYDLEQVTINAKSLIVLEDEGETVTTGALFVRNLGADQHVVFRGIDLIGGASHAPIIMVNDCAGSVWIEDVHIPAAALGAGAFCANSARLVFTRCQFDTPFSGLCGPHPTLQLQDSSVTLFETTVMGFSGPASPTFTLIPGEDAISLDGGELFLYGATIQGGGGGGGAGACSPGAPGGPGVRLAGSGPVVTVLDSFVAGGPGGLGIGGKADGVDGVDFELATPGARVDRVAALGRSFVVSPAARENGNVQVTFAGQPGDRVWVRFMSAPGPALFSRFWDGPFVVGTPPSRQFIGTLDASGALVLNVTLPNFGSGVEAVPFFTQAIFLGSRFVMSTPSFLLGLDDSF